MNTKAYRWVLAGLLAGALGVQAQEATEMTRGEMAAELAKKRPIRWPT